MRSNLITFSHVLPRNGSYGNTLTLKVSEKFARLCDKYTIVDEGTSNPNPVGLTIHTVLFHLTDYVIPLAA